MCWTVHVYKFMRLPVYFFEGCARGLLGSQRSDDRSLVQRLNIDNRYGRGQTCKWGDTALVEQRIRRLTPENQAYLYNDAQPAHWRRERERHVYRGQIWLCGKTAPHCMDFVHSDGQSASALSMSRRTADSAGHGTIPHRVHGMCVSIAFKSTHLRIPSGHRLQ
jgi:hypothetical protein